MALEYDFKPTVIANSVGGISDFTVSYERGAILVRALLGEPGSFNAIWPWLPIPTSWKYGFPMASISGLYAETAFSRSPLEGGNWVFLFGMPSLLKRFLTMNCLKLSVASGWIPKYSSMLNVWIFRHPNSWFHSLWQVSCKLQVGVFPVASPRTLICGRNLRKSEIALSCIVP